MYKTLHKKQGSVTVQLRFARSSVTFCAKRDKNGVTLSGYGLVDGKLHVQVRYADILNTDNHGDIYLKSNSGEILNCEKSISFWDESGVDSYEEYIFLVTAEEISNYEVWGEFWTGGELIEGDWQVTFPITEE